MKKMMRSIVLLACLALSFPAFAGVTEIMDRSGTTEMLEGMTDQFATGFESGLGQQGVPAEAVGKLSPGEVDGPVRSPFGWHIVRLDERREKPIPPLDAVRDTIRKELLSIVRKAAVADAHNAASVKILKDAVPADAIRDDALILP